MAAAHTLSFQQAVQQARTMYYAHAGRHACYEEDAGGTGILIVDGPRDLRADDIVHDEQGRPTAPCMWPDTKSGAPARTRRRCGLSAAAAY